MSEGPARFAQSFAETSLARDHSTKRLESIVRKLDMIADKEISTRQRGRAPACKAGCDACCHRTVPVSLPEAIGIASQVGKKDDSALRERIKLYRARTAPFRAHEQEARVACPLLADGLCTVYDARPLFCRGLSSFDAGACASWRDGDEVSIPKVPGQMAVARELQDGLRSALERARLPHGLYDLGLALGALLEDRELAERCTADKLLLGHAELTDDLWPASDKSAIPPGPPTDAQENPTPRSLPGDPTGRLPVDPLLKRFHRLCNRSRFEEANELLRQGGKDAYKLLRAWAPLAYRSEADIDLWRDRFLEAVDQLEHSQFDPKEVFDAIEWFNTFAIAYQARDVRPLVEPLGRILCEKITARAVPDLAEPIEPRKPAGKRRVGYISFYLRNSHGSKWARGWIENHGDEIETYAFNLNRVSDEISRDWERLADHYYHLPGRVPAAARFIKDLKLDALIFTDIGMAGPNYQFGSMRLAPVQCTAWGHPVTSGLPTIDYYLSSDLMEPAGAEAHYTERLVRLPGSGLCYPAIDAAPTGKTRSDLGLPDTGPIVLMVQNLFKLAPKFDWIFKAISDRLGCPIVFVLSSLKSASDVIRRRLDATGVNAIWIDRVEKGDYLRLLQLADVSLDIPEWSGGNTTIETLLLGTPVVAIPGQFMRGNHSVAFHKIAGVPGLIAKDLDDYLDLACDFDRQRAAMVGVDAGALFHDKRPVRALDELLFKWSGR
ncbi:MAG: YkgJ family cysteine cluster protein [Fimbriimonas ginsengisoli]|uniref:YkgJ family cysteine cluster protein n=1 Tax=Fimbriimonas ginsengisoli TaxID=1005039 RepID=A0A931LUA6_FIMGI|nr:YkgJ family cysteine cluster protein [Fimbriimonas ginsengisoli]